LSIDRTALSDELLGRYVLNALPDEEAEQVESLYFEDDGIFDRLLAVESDLIDAYVRGELDPARQKAFSRRLPGSERLRQRVEFARTLLKVSERPPLVRRRRVFAVLGIAASLLLVAGALLTLQLGQVQRGRRALENEASSLRRRISELETRVAGERSRADDLARKLEASREEPTPSTERPAKAPAVALRSATFLLTAGLVRGGSASNRVAIASDVELVRFELPLGRGGYDAYRAVLSDPDGRTLWSRNTLKGRSGKNGAKVTVSLPPKLLPPGDFVFTLEGKTEAGTWEDAADYSFRVVRQ
jgi:hypothetical protein